MKKHKSVVAILLAVMMIFTFMPTMSFAATDDHTWTLDPSKSIAATCYAEGLDVYSCIGEPSDGLQCEAVKAELVDPKPHTAKARPIQLSKADYLVRLATDWRWSPERVERYAERHAADCYVFVKECKDCGRVLDDTADWQGHKVPKGTPDCAVSYVCDFCGQTVLTGIGSGEKYANVHDYAEAVLIGENWCSDGSSPVAGYDVYTRTCKECGDVWKYFVPSNGGEEAVGIEHEKLEDFVVTPATCTKAGVKSRRCAVCGEEVPYTGSDGVKGVIPATGHDWETVNVPATCDWGAYSFGICKNCGATRHYEYSQDALGHEYKVEEIFPANCDAEGITRISCTRSDCGMSIMAPTAYISSKIPYLELDYDMIEDVDNEGYVVSKPTKDSKLYFVGFNYEFVDKHQKITKDAIEIKDWKKGAHDWGKYEDMKAADCEHGAFQATKCSICGHYNVHTAKETGDPVGHKWTTNTQDPTCGAKGFTYDVCSVCGTSTNVVPFGEPKVAYGTKCVFDKWVVEKAATPFAEGTKKLVCSECGDDGHLALVNGQVKELGVTRTTIAKTKIAAPKVKSLKKKAKVTVKAVNGAVKYQILVNGKVSKTVKKAGKFTVKKGIKAGKKNKFQIRAINGNNYHK